MTGRLIDADKTLERIESWNTSDATDKALYNFALNRIVEQPTVDAVPVIRCKDCKWCTEHYDADGNCPYWICSNWDGGTDADGFCYEAERKEE